MIFQWVTHKIFTISYTTQEVESFMEKDRTIQSKKKHKPELSDSLQESLNLGGSAEDSIRQRLRERKRGDEGPCTQNAHDSISVIRASQRMRNEGS